jgi:hypothetical protein
LAPCVYVYAYGFAGEFELTLCGGIGAVGARGAIGELATGGLEAAGVGGPMGATGATGAAGATELGATRAGVASGALPASI